MKAHMVEQGLIAALKGDASFSKDFDATMKSSVMEKAHSSLILSLGDKVLREVAKLETTKEIWEKLEELYTVKTVANKLIPKQKLLSNKIVEDQNVLDQLAEFSKITDDLEGVEDKTTDEDQALILLSYLPRSYDIVKDNILFGRSTTLLLSDVKGAIQQKELHNSSKLHSDVGAESMSVKYNGNKKSQHEGMNKYENKKVKEPKKTFDFVERRKCFNCHKKGHVKKNCPELRRGHKEFPHNGVNTADVEDCYEIVGALNVSEIQSDVVWLMDSRCSFHISLIRAWFTAFKYQKNGSVILEAKYPCKVKGSGSINIKMYDGATRTLKMLDTYRLSREISYL